MKAKLIMKYIGQGTILVLLNFFPIAIWKVIPPLVPYGTSVRGFHSIKQFIFDEFVARILGIFLYFLEFLSINGIFFLLIILISSIFSYTLDKFLGREMREKVKFVSSTFLKINFFLPKYISITIFVSVLHKIGSYVANEFLKRHILLGNDYFLFMCLIIISLAIVFNYLIIGIVYLIKNSRKLDV